MQDFFYQIVEKLKFVVQSNLKVRTKFTNKDNMLNNGMMFR